jgi:hypothetical protein
MALPFLKSESEENATQAIAFIGIVIMTIGLTIMNVTGAIAGSVGTTPGQIIIRGALAIILSGAELLAAVALVRVMLAQNNLRKIVGSVLFLGLAWACIQNGKRAVHLVYPEFAESAALLTAKADVAAADAVDLAAAKKAAIEATPIELAAVRTKIAKLEDEKDLMAAQSPEKIFEAQTVLIAAGKYFWEADGLRGEETEKAMRSRGEEIANELKLLKRREENLSAGAVMVSASTAAGAKVTDPAVMKADLEDKARKATAATIWLEVMLWVFEGARSFGLWALVATITAPKRKEAGAEDYSASVPEGMVDLRMTEAEWAAYEAALDVHSNIKDGAQKGARTRRRGKKIKNSEEYNREVIEVFMARRRKGETMENILQARGLTLGEFLATYDRSILSDDERELLLGEFDEAFEDEPKLDDAEQMTNGADQDTTDEEEGAEDEGDRTVS